MSSSGNHHIHINIKNAKKGYPWHLICRWGSPFSCLPIPCLSQNSMQQIGK